MTLIDFYLLKINIGDIYREQKSKYDFVTQYNPEKILDITHGKFFDYAKSEILLSNGTKEIWSLDLLNNEQYVTIRKFNDEKKILYSKKNISELTKSKFDVIISFNVMKLTEDLKPLLEITKNCLSENGLSIISILNNEIFENNFNSVSNSQNMLLTTNDFKKQLTCIFSTISLFSQGDAIQLKNYSDNVLSRNRLISTKSTIKHSVKKFFKSNDKLTSFYLHYILRLYQFYKNKRRSKKLKIPSTKYDVIPFSDQSTPISIIAVCKK